MRSSTSSSISVWLKDSDALAKGIRVVLNLCLAQQLLQSYPQFIGHRVCPSCFD